MIVRSKFPTDFGKTVNFAGKDLKFDRLGNCEIKDEKLAKELLAIFVGHLITEEQAKEVKSKENFYKEKNVEAIIDNMQAEIDKHKETIRHREGIIESTAQEVNEWKEQVEKLKGERDKAVEELNRVKPGLKKEIEDLKLQVKLTNLTNKELIDFCITMEIEEEKFKQLIKKEDLINLILDESRK